MYGKYGVFVVFFVLVKVGMGVIVGGLMCVVFDVMGV